MAPVAEIVYQRIIRPLLFRLDAETAHRVTIAFLAGIPAIARKSPPALATTVFGLEFDNPIGLAAGVDKDARAVGAWQTIGFGFAELGTVTAMPQPGNDRPRMWRLPEHRALVNRLGFPSAGMEVVASRLARADARPPRFRIGLNFGPNKSTAPDRITDNYVALIGRLGAAADFIVINVSSPNTPGLREWQSPDRLGALLQGIAPARDRIAHRPPILVKLAPDLDETSIAAICAAALEGGADGFVAGNTTLARAEIGVAHAPPGGLSGGPLRARARRLIRGVYRATGGAKPIIGVGGVASADDAFEHMRAGATLIELYTGLIYEGPALPGVIKNGLARLLAQGGFRSISDVAGSAARIS
jgi:dihydroorotate dehydrogenase